ncbi:hypothetical protein DLM45_10495 [Hyphomicrobium methylovorum]|uniref:tetratricopeptide repeat protein n=1 Tax=Hyphomicrobium methylovorum TaxID=84 RepID=UPI0015E65DD9|nr:tetratricopeptide repeat protein [Hyphomicrobium methylovorum]MBA2126646.1 hypothetical protein [Hyphomicrobium methylovorum]
MRTARPNFAALAYRKAPPFGVLASVTAALMLSACSASPDLLKQVALKSETPAPTESEPKTPQTELQRATTYWGAEYAKKPTEVQPAINYAKNLKALGEKRKALTVLQQASTIHGNDPQLAGEYGRLALELDQVNVASQLLAAADDPTKPDWRVVSARGTVLAKQGKYGEAIPYYERALTIAPDNPSVMSNLAMAHAMMGDPKTAEQILRQASTTQGATPKVRENLALVLGLQGRYEESKSIASSVLQTDVASANASYLKQMVRLDAKTEMPDAKSFAAQTSVARAETPPQPRAAEVQLATAVKPLPASPSLWETTSLSDPVPAAGSSRGF